MNEEKFLAALGLSPSEISAYMAEKNRIQTGSSVAEEPDVFWGTEFHNDVDP